MHCDDHVREIFKLYQQHGDVAHIAEHMNGLGVSYQEVMQVIAPYRRRQRRRYLLGMIASWIGGTIALWVVWEVMKSTDRFYAPAVGVGLCLYGVGLGCLYRILVHAR